MVEPGSGSHRPVPGSPIDRGQRQLGPARPGIVHERTRCRSQVQVRIGERGIRQASVGEVRAVEVGFRQVRTRQVRTRQVRTRQVRTREVRIGQVGSGQVRKAQVGIREVGVYQFCVSGTGRQERRTLQDSVRECSISEDGEVEVDIGGIHSEQEGPCEVGSTGPGAHHVGLGHVRVDHGGPVQVGRVHLRLAEVSIEHRGACEVGAHQVGFREVRGKDRLVGQVRSVAVHVGGRVTGRT